VFPDHAAREQFDAFRNNDAKRRKIEWIENFGSGGDFPNKEETENAKQAEPIR
jgi:hypothetical protein